MQELRELAAGTRVIHFPLGNEICRVVERKNRFVVHASSDGRELICHLHDPGRLRELIYPGNEILVRKQKGAKTAFSVTAAMKSGEWILTDARFHNRIASRFLPDNARPEVRTGKSRIDFLADGCYVEVKGCSLEVDGVALFPDAPSERAARHMRELASIKESGGYAMVIVLVFSPVAGSFRPNLETDPVFNDAFYHAIDSGVNLRILKFRTDTEGITYLGRIPLNGNG